MAEMYHMATLAKSILHIALAITVGFWKASEYILLRMSARTKKYARHVREEIKAHFSEDFIYNNLSEPNAIRLLSILPGTANEPIRCSLEEVSLNDAPAYNALSYSWKRNLPWKFWGLLAVSLLVWLPLSCLQTIILGREIIEAPFQYIKIDDEKLFWISCNSKRMKVHENLYDFLIQLRQLRVTERFWIDALCINQSNNSERNSQVRLMAWIYRSAQNVVVWLGPCPSLLDNELVMGRVSSAIRVSHITPTSTKDSWLGTESISWHGPIIVTRLVLKTLARLHLLSRSYFRRTWIIQEIILSSRVTFWIGRYKLQPEQLVEIADLFDAPTMIGSEAQLLSVLFFLEVSTGVVRRLLNERQRFQHDLNWNLADYILVARGHQATEIRDLVFAGLGLIAEPISTSQSLDPDGSTTCELLDYNSNCLSHPDYSASLTQVFVDCTEQLLQEVGLFAFSLACDGHQWIGLPSWVPHFERKTEPFKNDLGPKFSAGGKLQAQVRIAGDRKLLHINSGAEHLDYITSIYKTLDEKTLMTVIASLPGVYKFTDEAMVSAIARTLVADHLNSHAPAPTSITEELMAYMKKAKKVERQQMKAQSVPPQGRIVGRIFNLIGGYSKEFKEQQAQLAQRLGESELELDAAFANCRQSPSAANAGPQIAEDTESFKVETGYVINADFHDAKKGMDELSISCPIPRGGTAVKEHSMASNTSPNTTLGGANSSAHASPLAGADQAATKLQDSTLQEIYDMLELEPGTSIVDTLKEAILIKSEQEVAFEEAKIKVLEATNILREASNDKKQKAFRKILDDAVLLTSKLENNESAISETIQLLRTVHEVLDEQRQMLKINRPEPETKVATDVKVLDTIKAMLQAVEALQSLRKTLTNSENKISWLKAAKTPLFLFMISDSSDFVKVFEQRCEQRCFFITEKGYIGLGSLSLEKGDSIVVLPGAYVPFAMTASRAVASERPFKDMAIPREEEEKCRAESTVIYRLKGEVYVHGVMHGERTTCSDWNPKPIILE